MEIIFCLGGNQGNRFELLKEARKALSLEVGKIVNQSDIYETEAWGFEAEQNFYNQVISVDSELDPHEALHRILKIEKTLGRVRISEGYSSRTMDIDIIAIENQIIDTPNLVVPHPRMHERKFVLYPLVDVASNWNHPLLGKNAQALLNECNDECNIINRFSVNEYMV